MAEFRSGEERSQHPGSSNLSTSTPLPRSAVAISPDGRWFASAGRDGVVILSEIVEGKLGNSRKLLDHTSGVECLVFSPDSQRLASGSLDSKVRLHELPGKLVRTYDGLGMENEPVAGRVQSRVLALAWQDQLVAGTSEGILYRLSLGDDTSRRIARNGRDPIYALAFDARGETSSRRAGTGRNFDS